MQHVQDIMPGYVPHKYRLRQERPYSLISYLILRRPSRVHGLCGCDLSLISRMPRLQYRAVTNIHFHFGHPVLMHLGRLSRTSGGEQNSRINILLIGAVFGKRFSDLLLVPLAHS